MLFRRRKQGTLDIEAVITAVNPDRREFTAVLANVRNGCGALHVTLKLHPCAPLPAVGRLIYLSAAINKVFLCP